MKKPINSQYAGRPGAFRRDMDAYKAWEILEEIKRLDAIEWSQPSNKGALAVMDLEAEYEKLTGRDCPTWPERKEQ